MAKRFIDTGIFDDTWFMDLSKDAKIAWLYLITKCDHAGIIEINEKLMILQTGIKSWATVSQELKGRLVHLRDKYFFIPKFIQFQYPNFPKSNVNQQVGAIKRLCEFGLFCDGQVIDLQALNSSSTLDQDLTKSYGNDNVDNKSNKYINTEGGNDLKIPIEEEIKVVNNWRKDFNVYYEECREAFDKAWNDDSYISEQQRFHPNVNIRLSLEKAFKNYWGTEAGWEFKKGKKKQINWRSTINNAISLNKVYYTKAEQAELYK